jgi:hypothetical protein
MTEVRKADVNECCHCVGTLCSFGYVVLGSGYTNAYLII